MQKQAENSGKPTRFKSKFLIVVLVMLAAVSAWFSKDYVAQHFKNFDYVPTKSIPPVVDENINDNLSSPNHKESTIISNHDQSIHAQADLKQPLANNIKKIIGEDLETCARNNDDRHTHVDNYRNYLSNIGSLVANFLQDKAYSNQIACARIVNFPPSINGILELLEEYNVNYLITDEKEYVKVFPKDYKFIKKFIKIKKLTKSAKNKKKMREVIVNNLEIFQEYFYSNELQKMFTGQRE